MERRSKRGVDFPRGICTKGGWQLPQSAPVFVKSGSSKALVHEFSFTKRPRGPRRNTHAHKEPLFTQLHF